MAGPVDGFYFEIVIIVLAVVWDVMTLVKYLQKRNAPTLLLFATFVNWTVAIVFSWLSKAFEVFLFSGNPVPLDQPFYLFFRLVMTFRISFLFVCVALFVSYLLRANFFEQGGTRAKKAAMGVFGAAVASASVLILDMTDLDNVIVFFLVFSYMATVYFPFMSRAIKLARSPEGIKFKTAFFSLAMMSLLFILVFLNFFIDQLMFILVSQDYTPFYFGAWICAIAGFISAYLGYIRPPPHSD